MRPKRAIPTLCAALCLALGGAARATTLTGSTAGAFVDPAGPPNMRVIGVGTDAFAWGISATAWRPPCSLRFTGAPISTPFDAPFSFGTLSYFNGTTVSGTEAVGIDLAISLSLLTPTDLTRVFEYPLHLINSPNVADPVASADSILFPTVHPTAGFSFGGANYTLAFEGFGSVTGGGFVPLPSNRFFVLEWQTASAELIGRITADPARPVPEPGTLALLGTGLAALLGRIRRRG